MAKWEPWPEKAGTEQPQLTLNWDAVGWWSRCGHVACTQVIQHGVLSNQRGLRLSDLGQVIRIVQHHLYFIGSPSRRNATSSTKRQCMMSLRYVADTPERFCPQRLCTLLQIITGLCRLSFRDREKTHPGCFLILTPFFFSQVRNFVSVHNITAMTISCPWYFVSSWCLAKVVKIFSCFLPKVDLFYFHI